MFRRSLALAVVGLITAGTFVAMPAQAATVKVANGVVCPTLGKTAKANGYTYKCFLNTVVSKTKKTWTTTDCINADTQYRQSSKAYKELVLSLPATLADFDTKIAEELAKDLEDNAKADALQAQIVDWQAKVISMNTALDKATAERNRLSTGTISSQANTAILSLNSSMTSLRISISTLNTAIRAATLSQTTLRKVGRAAVTLNAGKAAATQSLTTVKSGVAQTFSLRKLICQKGV